MGLMGLCTMSVYQYVYFNDDENELVCSDFYQFVIVRIQESRICMWTEITFLISLCMVSMETMILPLMHCYTAAIIIYKSWNATVCGGVQQDYG